MILQCLLILEELRANITLFRILSMKRLLVSFKTEPPDRLVVTLVTLEFMRWTFLTFDFMA